MKTYTKLELQDILFEEHPDFDHVEDKMIGKWRWGTTHRVIVRELETGQLYSHIYQLHSEDGIQDYEQNFKKVKRIEKVVIDYQEEK